MLLPTKAITKRRRKFFAFVLMNEKDRQLHILLANAIVEKAIIIERAIKKRSKELILKRKAKKIESDNFTRSNKRI